MKRKPKCCICGKAIQGYGNNPWPVREKGKCCDICNATIVFNARLKEYENAKVLQH